LNFREAWRVSKVPYTELTYRSAVMTRGSARGRFGLAAGSSGVGSVKSIMRGAFFSKAIFTVFIGAGTIFTFSQYIVDRSAAYLVGGVSFSLAITLAYLVLYSLQVLPSFASSEPYSLLSTLPLADRDLSLVTLLSVVRTFDTIAAVAIIGQVAMVAILTGSVQATVLMAFASGANAIFGVAVSLWLSGVFQRNITRGGRGKTASVARFVFLISWGLAAASLGFMFNLVDYAVPALDSAVAGAFASTALPIVFALIHPFSAGLAIASVVSPEFTLLTPTLSLASQLSFVALALYVGLALYAARKTLAIAASVARGPAVTAIHQRATEFLLRVRNPIPAYVVKDVRISSKNPSSAFIYALPVLDTVVIALTVSGSKELHAVSILSSTALGCVFTLISASILLNTEGSGLDYTLSLPLSARVIVLAKSIIATVAYLPVPAVICALLLLGGSTAPWLYLIPVIEVAAVSAATSAELSFFIQRYRKAGGRQTSSGIETRGLNLMSASDLIRFVGALLVAGGLVGGPIIAYTAAYAATFDHGLALVSMGLVALAEFVVVHAYLRRS
jgi:predicted permease